MATKLALYRAATIECEQIPMDTLTEAGEARRLLDAVYDNVVLECLSYGSWNFAMETVKLTADTGVEPNFGQSEIFAKPADWMSTHWVSYDENFSMPSTDYVDEGGQWVANGSPLYVRYVSSDTGLGLELTRWPPRFTRYVELELANRIVGRINQDKSLRDRIEDRRDKMRTAALNQDSMNDAQGRRPPPGSWTRSRGGGGGDRGSRSNLTG
jgi:hypothetical protein